MHVAAHPAILHLRHKTFASLCGGSLFIACSCHSDAVRPLGGALGSAEPPKAAAPPEATARMPEVAALPPLRGVKPAGGTHSLLGGGAEEVLPMAAGKQNNVGVIRSHPRDVH